MKKGKEHCHRGDVFQVVLSRQFSRRFKGDEFNVYRALRSINPSPYLFYFDFGSYKIFGSSPEAHLKIQKNKAYINPIAGTFSRTGNDEDDKMVAERLSYDLKENAEHVMLVDLARNDLSRHARNVRVEKLQGSTVLFPCHSPGFGSFRGISGKELLSPKFLHQHFRQALFRVLQSIWQCR